MRQIEAAGLTLEPQTVAHAAEMFVVLSDPAIYEFENSPPLSPEWLANRFARLESRQSADGQQQWLNWVIRCHDGALIGYVQATITADQRAMIAYELGSAWWGRGFAFAAVSAMMDELAERYAVSGLSAILKDKNFRSRRLLERLGFALATQTQSSAARIDPDEILMLRAI